MRRGCGWSRKTKRFTTQTTSNCHRYYNPNWAREIIWSSQGYKRENEEEIICGRKRGSTGEAFCKNSYKKSISEGIDINVLQQTDVFNDP